ncbi:DEAD/DEAH box helicase [Tomitella biformata]|uniref:DEAD/DEAH box helicase n=1 Tax=Tomitella biformata TaxID=630403 RepID=UPI0004B2F3AB|nr:DEAD/DEAH box helicase family protein [Tomitella biformata]
MKDYIYRALENHPLMDVHQIMQKLPMEFRDQAKVNAEIYYNSDLFAQFYITNSRRPRWATKAYSVNFVENSDNGQLGRVNYSHFWDYIEEGEDISYLGPELREWQSEALEKWGNGGYRAIVEAVTGAGKTGLAVVAAYQAIEEGFNVLVVVPGTPLMRQWYDVLNEQLDAVVVGLVGDGKNGTFHDCHVLVSTIQSINNIDLGGPDAKYLLIADEVHGYGSPVWSTWLPPRCSRRLGLTATLERSDDGVNSRLIPYFGESFVGCDYPRAYRDGLLADVYVALVPVDLQPDERVQYDQHSKQVSRLQHQLEEFHGLDSSDYGEFMANVEMLKRSGNRDESIAASRYLNAVNKRRELLSGCIGKVEAVTVFGKALQHSNAALVFTGTKAMAKVSCQALISVGVRAQSIDSDVEKNLRPEILSGLTDGSIKAVCAPLVLDQGIDVPNVDMGLVLSASRTRRQMIQRIGRIIRLKEDGRAGIFTICYVRNSVEDPKVGVHAKFLSEIQDVALEVCDVEMDRFEETVRHWRR